MQATKLTCKAQIQYPAEYSKALFFCSLLHLLLNLQCEFTALIEEFQINPFARQLYAQCANYSTPQRHPCKANHHPTNKAVWANNNRTTPDQTKKVIKWVQRERETKWKRNRKCAVLGLCALLPTAAIDARNSSLETRIKTRQSSNSQRTLQPEVLSEVITVKVYCPANVFANQNGTNVRGGGGGGRAKQNKDTLIETLPIAIDEQISNITTSNQQWLGVHVRPTQRGTAVRHSNRLWQPTAVKYTDSSAPYNHHFWVTLLKFKIYFFCWQIFWRYTRIGKKLEYKTMIFEI